MTQRVSNRGGHDIHHPNESLTLEQRAFQMWAVHPVDLDNLGFKGDRQGFYLAHLQAAVKQLTPPNDKTCKSCSSFQIGTNCNPCYQWSEWLPKDSVKITYATGSVFMDWHAKDRPKA